MGVHNAVVAEKDFKAVKKDLKKIKIIKIKEPTSKLHQVCIFRSC